MGRPKRETNEASRRFHDRVAKKYDSIYDDDFWDFHDRVTWAHLKTFVPKTPGVSVLDLGCGTGKWGLKLLKMGYPTTFADLSQGMLDEVTAKLDAWRAQPDLKAKAEKATITLADAVELNTLPQNHFELVIGMGDVVSICSDPAKCLGQVFTLLKPGGVFVFTVDNQLAALDHFAVTGNLKAMSDFIRTGGTHWLTRDEAEQFDVHMFTPASIAALTTRYHYELISQIGKTVIPARKNKKFFEGPGAVETLVELEQSLQKDAAAAARASHLQIAARKRPDTSSV